MTALEDYIREEWIRLNEKMPPPDGFSQRTKHSIDANYTSFAPMKESTRKIIELLEQGLEDEDIIDKLGVTGGAVAGVRSRYGFRRRKDLGAIRKGRLSREFRENNVLKKSQVRLSEERCALYFEDKSIKVTPTTFIILSILVENLSTPLTTFEIVRKINSDHINQLKSPESCVRSAISKTRTDLSAIGLWIYTLSQGGYVLAKK